MDELDPRPASTSLLEWAQIAGELVMFGYMLDVWTNGAVRDVLRSFVAQGQRIAERLPSHRAVSEVLRRAEAITREAAEGGS